MKFTFKPSPNYHAPLSTTDIMKHLTIALGAVLLASIIWYGVSYGLALRVIMLTVCAIASALLTETAYFAFTKSKDIRHDVTHSYGWVTAIIIVLLSKIDVSYYAIVICVAVAILFGKMLFGGFGQNIFNPAAFGTALIMNAFSSSGSNCPSSTLRFRSKEVGTPASYAFLKISIISVRADVSYTRDIPEECTQSAASIFSNGTLSLSSTLNA